MSTNTTVDIVSPDTTEQDTLLSQTITNDTLHFTPTSPNQLEVQETSKTDMLAPPDMLFYTPIKCTDRPAVPRTSTPLPFSIHLTLEEFIAVRYHVEHTTTSLRRRKHCSGKSRLQVVVKRGTAVVKRGKAVVKRGKRCTGAWHWIQNRRSFYKIKYRQLNPGSV